jgi:P4 family phage/plasmid primase-like protien
MQKEEFDAEITRLASLELIDYYRESKDAAKGLGITKKELDRCIKEAKRKLNDEETAEPEPETFTGVWLQIGSDLEIARLVINDMLANDELYVYSEGAFYHWTGRLWEELDDIDIQKHFVSRYDGARYGSSGVIRLDQQKVKSIVKFVAQEMKTEDFFSDRPLGVNCQNGFVVFEKDGNVNLVEHHPGQKCRTICSGSYEPCSGLPAGSLLRKFFSVLPYDHAQQAEKHLLIQEMFGVAVAGIATRIPQPKAFVLSGRSANNGKSRLLDLLEGLVSSYSNVSAHEFSDRNTVIQMRGKDLNTSAELTSSTAVSSEIFKKVITGDPLTGKFLYKDVLTFRSTALNVFATNKLPPFAGGIDPGVRRRLIVIEFENSIPLEDQVEDLHEQIIENEFDLLLSWAIEGAARVIRNGGFTVPASSVAALARWTADTDVVKAWIEERVRPAKEGTEHLGYIRRDAYTLFAEWAEANHHRKDRLPSLSEFVDRLAEVFPSCKRTKDSRRLRGITILFSDPLDAADLQADLMAANDKRMTGIPTGWLLEMAAENLESDGESYH